MKTWNVPAVEELNVELTANGRCNKEAECWLWNPNGGKVEQVTPTTPQEPEGDKTPSLS